MIKEKPCSVFWLGIILWISLFVPAGTVDFWQAWIYLFLFCGSSLMITLFLMKKDMELLKRRINAGAAAEKERSQKIIQLLASFSFIGILLTPGFDHRFKWSNVPYYLVITGEIFVVLGFYIVFLVFKENSYTSATIEIAENQKVISTGPYAVVRHPMYSGALLMLVFTPLALGSYWDFIFSILIFIVIVWRLLDEEKFLTKNLPGYEAYCTKTRFRLVPAIW
ncbi:MAG TPA: isoprenylcysteine carboxylmethyltransferase family protein [Puia sp.]|nr:isoprenylcysteine carboxylmethyltransferase family protein [Puia sp.]